jgi:hypothetical protein
MSNNKNKKRKKISPSKTLSFTTALTKGRGKQLKILEIITIQGTSLASGIHSKKNRWSWKINGAKSALLSFLSQVM